MDKELIKHNLSKLTMGVTFTKVKFQKIVNPVNANPTKWSDTLKQFVDNFPTFELSECVGLVVKGLRLRYRIKFTQVLHKIYL